MMHRALDAAVLDKGGGSPVTGGNDLCLRVGGNSSMIASELQNRLFRLGSRITASNDHNMQLMLTAAARTNDVIIGYLSPGETRSWCAVSGSLRKAASPRLH